MGEIKLSEQVATQEVKNAQTSTTPTPLGIKPDQTNEEEAKQQEHKQAKQGTDAVH